MMGSLRDRVAVADIDASAPQARHGRERYSAVAMGLHWAIALCMAFVIGIGWRLEARPSPETYALYQLHKSVGILILFLSLVRIGWRWRKPPPALPQGLSRMESMAAHGVHIGLYILLIGMPLSGWLLVSTSARPIPTYLFGLIHWPDFPGMAGLSESAREMANGSARFGHHKLIVIGYLMLAGHIAGALKHQFVDGKDYFNRMLPVARRWLGGAMLACIAAAGLSFAIGQLIRPRPIAPAKAANAATAVPAIVPVGKVSAATIAPAIVEDGHDAAPAPDEKSADTGEAAAPDAPSRWNVQAAASTVGFSTSYAGTPIKGVFGNWKADIGFSPDALDRSSVKVDIDLRSVRSDSPDAQSMLPGADWFATASWSQARFAASRFRALGGDRYEADGQLTLRGKSRPQKLLFSLKISGDRARVSGSATIDRTAFGVGQGDWASTADLAADVPVTFELAAVRAPARKGQ